MATTRRILSCGHVRRIDTSTWRRRTLAEREVMYCKTCKAPKKIAGMVPMKERSEA